MDVPFIEELLGRHIEVLADVKESLHGGQGLLVFDVVDIVVRLFQRQGHITGRYALLRPQLCQPFREKIFILRLYLSIFSSTHVWVWVHFEGYTYTGYIIHYPPPKTIPLSLKFQEFLP